MLPALEARGALARNTRELPQLTLDFAEAERRQVEADMPSCGPGRSSSRPLPDYGETLRPD